jgi:predicted AAA+ superfamily ATPase
MEGFSLAELGKYAELDSVLQYGTLPIVWSHLGSAPEVLDAYVHTYMKQEIQEEGLVRKISPFLRFLGVAGQLNGQVVNGHGIARDAGVPRATVDTYFSILFDTLLGHLLPAWRPEAKVREAVHPKFYWFDPGVARAAAGYTFDPPDRTWLGFALETILFHELRVYNTTSAKHRGISYYRTPAGIEVDFVIETTKRQATKKPHVVLIESKLSPAWDRRWEKPMLDLAAQSSLTVDRMFGVYNGNRTYHFGPVTVVPVVRFVEMLFEGNVF